MRNMIIMATCLAIALTGCSVLRTEFKETAEGGVMTSFTTSLLLAPFSELKGSDAQMAYKWGGTESIAVGQGVDSLDQTGQAAGITTLIQSLTGLIVATKAPVIAVPTETRY